MEKIKVFFLTGHYAKPHIFVFVSKIELLNYELTLKIYNFYKLPGYVLNDFALSNIITGLKFSKSSIKWYTPSRIHKEEVDSSYGFFLKKWHENMHLNKFQMLLRQINTSYSNGCEGIFPQVSLEARILCVCFSSKLNTACMEY